MAAKSVPAAPNRQILLMTLLHGKLRDRPACAVVSPYHREGSVGRRVTGHPPPRIGPPKAYKEFGRTAAMTCVVDLRRRNQWGYVRASLCGDINGPSDLRPSGLDWHESWVLHSLRTPTQRVDPKKAWGQGGLA